jgi:transposase
VSEVSTVGLDLAKHVFQAHGADVSGKIVFRKRLRREQVLGFFAALPACVVAMEACSSAHHWARELSKMGHQARLIPPAYVKPFVKRQKHDASDAEAICEAAQRPTMRFVAVKSEAAQANAVVFRARDLLVRQRTQEINSLRGHLGEYGLVVAKGPSHVTKLMEHVEDPASDLPEAARLVLRVLVESLQFLSERIAFLDREIARRAREDSAVRRLTTIPGVGPITATAVAALAPPPETFRKGRDFAPARAPNSAEWYLRSGRPFQDAGRKTTPSIGLPAVTKRQSAMISLRARATIMVLRVPIRLSAVRARYHNASALSF